MNLQASYGASTSSWCVCQFHHRCGWVVTERARGFTPGVGEPATPVFGSGRQRATRRERAVFGAGQAPEPGGDCQTTQSETFTFGAEAEQGLLLELIERLLKLGDADARAFTKRGQVGTAATAGRAKDQNQ